LNRKLHILFLSGWYPSRVLPSNGDFVQRHAEAVATKHKVTLIHVVTDKNLKFPEKTFHIINNVNTHIIFVPKTKNHISKLSLFFNTYVSTIKTIKNFDIVHLNITFPVGLIALYLKWFTHKPYIISEHWTGYQSPQNKSIGFLQKKITKTILKNASFVCPVSENLENEMINIGFKGNYYPVPNVVNTSIFNIDKNSIKNFTITHISHMGNEHKNITGILNVMSKMQLKIPNLAFKLIGPNSSSYINLVKKLRIKNITIIGEIPHSEIIEHLKKSNLFVLFSNYENLPCVILESFACGVPVISTNVGGIYEFFPKNFGYLIPPRDEVALENSILKIYNGNLYQSPELMHQYAKNNFGIESISEKFTNLYLKSIEREK